MRVEWGSEVRLNNSQGLHLTIEDTKIGAPSGLSAMGSCLLSHLSAATKLPGAAK
ncbi:hypothetical protein QQP08_022975, partial [Theobroma cacao]